MAEHTLPRTGDVPLTFDGELVAESSSYNRDGPGENRYHTLKLYRTSGGRYVLAIHFESAYRGEGPRRAALVCGTAAAVRDEIFAYNPVPNGVGYPPGREYEGKQQRMAETLRFLFARAVSDLFTGFGDEMAERID